MTTGCQCIRCLVIMLTTDEGLHQFTGEGRDIYLCDECYRWFFNE